VNITCPFCWHTWDIEVPDIPWRALPASTQATCPSCHGQVRVMLQEKDGHIEIHLYPITVRTLSDKKKEEITLTFKVPETDFDMAQVEAALHWLAEKYTKNTRYDWTGQSDEAAMRSLYALLLTIQHQYAEKLGQPDWKMPPLA
jgi:hypothetical protein